MIYLFDFNGCPRGWYNRTEIQVSHVNGRLVQFTDGQILMTDPDLEAFAAIADPDEMSLYAPVSIDAVHKGTFSIDAMKHIKHYVLVEGIWVFLALSKKVHADCFELSFGGGVRLWTHTLAIGEPDIRGEETE